ncbi:MAG: hypothetical protein ABI054_01865 [Planctomycetota bacterium]
MRRAVDGEAHRLESGAQGIRRIREGGCNAGLGIEGRGIAPHEIVSYDAKDLAKGVDTLIRRAQELLAKFPQEKVPYKAR